MFKSMTAYGRASSATSFGRVSVELHCVNRKHLEIQTSLPKELIRFDGEIKKLIAAAVGRGQVNVRIAVAFERESPLVIKPNLPLARQVKNAWKSIETELAMELHDDALARLLSLQQDILVVDEELVDDDKYLVALREAISLALIKVLEMKQREGAALYEDIALRFGKLANWIEEIAVKSPTAVERYREKLVERMQEILAPSAELDDRLLREVCVYADKIDITEELTRFRSHLKQVQTLIESVSPQGVAKPLEFLVQELNREINTISAKSTDPDVTRLVIEVKTELERIREQIQNIE